eukprot:Skav204160  [mRNA]  locus=scaffold903:331321:332944:+ [translate_table: standard]
MTHPVASPRQRLLPFFSTDHMEYSLQVGHSVRGGTGGAASARATSLKEVPQQHRGAMNSSAWLCYLSLGYIYLQDLQDQGGDIEEILPIESQNLRMDFSRRMAKHHAAGVRCEEIFLHFAGLNVTMAQQLLNEFVFWAASLANHETRLVLRPEEWFHGTETFMDVINLSVGASWVVPKLKESRP